MAKKFVLTCLMASSLCSFALFGAGCKKEETAKESASAPAQQQAVAPAAQTGLPSYDFENGAAGWVANGSVKIEQATDQKHGGNSSLKISATGSDKLWNFAVSPNINLEPGKKYKLSGWLYIDSWNNTKFPPMLKFAISQNGKFVDNAFSSKYNLKKTKDWQKLECTFVAPEGAAANGYIALEKATQDNIATVSYLDDIQLELAK
jgi:hypothetical protein